MSVLKYIDPVTGEFVKTNTVKIVDGAPEQLTASGYPDYITPAVLDMVERVNAVRMTDSIVFIAMSDNHYVADQELNFYDKETNASADQATRAAKVLTYLVKPDFVAHLGDVATGHRSTTPEMLKRQIEEFNAMFLESRSDVPVFMAIGNHDTGIYYHDAQTDGEIHTMTGDYLYKNFTALSASADTVIAGKENGGYCYRDFPDKKLRVFLLNTSEKLVAIQTDASTYGAQRLWLANALRDLNTKEDAVEWSFIILSHYPADYGATSPLSDLLKAYVEGANYTIRDDADGTNQSGSFAGYNGAKMVAQFHGHVHNFKTDKLYSGGTQYDAQRVCIPNGQYGRENYYGVVGGIDYAEPETYPKTADTAEGTSFVVNVVNPSEQIIYSFCYGAGYDRVVGYASTVYHSIKHDLANVTLSSNQRGVEAGKAYEALLTVDEGYELKSVKVTMDGVNITETAYNNITLITIPEVTGNVVITARAQLPANFTNLVPWSKNMDGTYFETEDGRGYDNDTYINSSGVIATKKGVTSTGYIHAAAARGMVLRVAGEGLSIDPTYTRVAAYDEAFNLIICLAAKNMGIQHTATGAYYNGKLIDEASTLFTLEIGKECSLSKAVYFRVCVNGDGADLIVTVNEPITYG